MFISSKQAFRFTDGENEFTVPAGYVGDFPAWAAQTYLYQLAIKDGSITAVGEATDSATAESEADAANTAAEDGATATATGKGKA